MVAFIAKLLRLCRPYRRRLALGVLMGLLGGFLEPLLFLCVKIAVDVAFPGANVASSGSPAFSQDSINNFPALVTQLKAHNDPVSGYLWNHSSPELQEKIAAYSPGEPTPTWLPESVVAELNQEVFDPKLYDAQRFANVKLSRRAQKLLAEKRADSFDPKLNRALLESAYPSDLTEMKLSTLDKLLDRFPWLEKRLAALTQWLPSAKTSSSGW